MAIACDFDCINYFTIANNKTVPQDGSNTKEAGIDWLVGFVKTNRYTLAYILFLILQIYTPKAASKKRKDRWLKPDF